MIRVLQVFSILNAGGMENYVMNMYRMIDRNKVQFDFVVHHRAEGLYEEEIRQLGGRVYHFSVLDDYNIPKYIKELNKFFKKHREYKIVHGHLSSLAYLYLGAAKRCGVPCRISHSHGASFLRTPKGYAKYILFRSAKFNANYRFACSADAGRYLYGKDSFEILPNSIQTDRFVFSAEVRKVVRRELKAENDFLIGHVGRFNLQKNHKYLLHIFKVFSQEILDSKLILLGDGELKHDIEELIEDLGLTGKVILAGVKKDCGRYYQAMDVFVLPSLFEGLPVTGIEAQHAGLPCIFSDKITKEVQISNKVDFIGISSGDIGNWVKALKDIRSSSDDARRTDITNNRFDAAVSAKNMQNRYLHMLEEQQ